MKYFSHAVVLLIFILLGITSNFSCSTVDRNCELSDTLLLGFRYGMSPREYNSHVNKLASEKLANKNTVCIKAPFEDYNSKKIVDSDNWFIICPKFHPLKGLYEISLKSIEEEIGGLITNSFWDILQKKYGERDIAANRGEIVSEGTNTYYPSSEFEITPVHEVLNAHQNTDIIWDCKGRQVRVRQTEKFHLHLYNTSIDEELVKLKQNETNTDKLPSGGSFAIVYVNTILAQDLEIQVDQQNQNEQDRLKEEYKKQIEKSKNQL